MGKTKGNNTSTMGIKAVPLCGVIGAYKYTKSDWTMVAFVIPRSALKQDITEKELQYNGIYFLMGRDGITDKAYVGQAKKRNGGGSILVRLREHNDSKTEAYRDIWNYAVVITSGNDDWGPTELNALENIFYNEIDSKNRLNGNEPNSGGYGDEVDYQEKVRQTKAFFKFSNMNVFKDVEQSEEIHMLEVEMPENYIMEDLQKGMSNIPEILTPIKVVKEMVDMLPAEVFNPDTRFLDMVCKGGEFLKEIYNRLMETESLIALFPDPIMRAMHILDKQLFGIALSQESQDRANRNLYGYAEAKKNIKRIKNYISAVKGRNIGKKEDSSYKTLEDLLKEEFGTDMKFDVVIGNPPYQESNGGGGNTDGGKALYQHFINSAYEIGKRYISMITKNSWYRTRDTGGNKGFDIMKSKMIQGGNLVSIVDYPKYHEVFPSIGCSVSYFLADMQKTERSYEFVTVIDGKVENKFIMQDSVLRDIIRGKELSNIANKVNAVENMSEFTLAKLAFGIDTTGISDCSLVSSDDYKIKLVANGDVNYIRKDSISKNKDKIELYKVICTRAVSAWSGDKENVITSIGLLKPNEICTGTYSVLFYTVDEKEAIAAEKYIKTKFVRELLRCTIDARGVISKTTFEYVPIQDFTDSSDIDWSQSIADIDKQLYKKYGLSQEEIDYIEYTIKPMN